MYVVYIYIPIILYFVNFVIRNIYAKVNKIICLININLFVYECNLMQYKKLNHKK